jgi:hypothetical protein
MILLLGLNEGFNSADLTEAGRCSPHRRRLIRHLLSIEARGLPNGRKRASSSSPDAPATVR